MTVYANILQPLIDVFEAVLVFFHDTFGIGWGFSIILLTVCVRVLLLPLTLKQFKSMQSMAHHRDDIQALQAKYKGDRDRLNQEMMKFYKENQINPLASCLPLVAQLPVFISLFYMLRKDLLKEVCGIDTTAASHATSCPDSAATQFLFIPNITERATGAVLITMIVLYVGSQLLSTVMSTVNTDNTQKYIMWALPFVFVAFVWQFPAGLLLYWITTNFWTIVQQLIVKQRLGPIQPPRDPNKPKPPGLLEQLRGVTEPATASSGNARSGGGGGRNSGGGSQPKGRTTAAPPAPPRKKKKRSGRRR